MGGGATTKKRLTIWCMSLYAIIPVKPFANGKARLAPVLSPEARASLCQRLLEHVLDAACAAVGLDEIVVVSGDDTVRVIAAARGAACIDDPLPDRSGLDGLNAALAMGRHEAVTRLASAILVLPADLAFVTAEDIGALIAAGGGPAMVIAPDEAQDGTNALLLSPPNLIGFSFGPDSFEAHCAASVTAGIKPTIVERPGLGFDVDAPEDLSRIAGHYPLF
ncbi:MAG: 2-phospho-L-lactate guanylyltransferase [Alphaproteobacteria bacterium]